MVAVGAGSQAQIQKQISSMGTNLIMVMPPRGPREANRLEMSDVQKLRKEASYLSAITGEVRLSSSKVVGGSGSWSTSVYGIEPDYVVIKDWAVDSGEFFTDRDLNARAKVAVLGSTVAEELFPGEDPVGQSVRIGSTPFTIVGVLASKGSTGMGNDQDDVVMVPLDTALKRLTHSTSISSIQMSAVREDLMAEAQAEVTTILREAHRLGGADDDDFNIRNLSEIVAAEQAASQVLSSLLAAVASVSLLVGGIGIMNIMLVSVTERTREIGLRLAVGARQRDILTQFLAEAVILSLVGALTGVALGIAGTQALAHFADWQVVLQADAILISVISASVVGVFFGWYPARKAARMAPIEALRYE